VVWRRKGSGRRGNFWKGEEVIPLGTGSWQSFILFLSFVCFNIVRQ
jgi:hypothetical protein